MCCCGCGDKGSNGVTSLHRPLSPKDKALMDDATRDLNAAVRTAHMLLNEARRKVGLPPLPPPG